MYFGNFAGVLQYDGEFWKLIPTTNITRISSLASDSSGTIYVGARGEIGKLDPDLKGELHFKSLFEHGEKSPVFLDVFQILIASEGVVFITRNCIFIFRSGNMETWTSKDEILNGFLCNNKIYPAQSRHIPAM